jgi:hypothetical protein
MCRDFVNCHEQLVSVVALRCQPLLLSEMRPSLLLGSLFCLRFKPLIPRSKSMAETTLSAVKGKAVASHKPAAL